MQAPFLQDDDFLLPESDFGFIVASILGLKKSSRILIIDLSQHIANFLSSQGHDVVWIRSNEELDKQVEKLERNAPYDCAVIMPVFAAQQPYITPPSGWLDLKKTFSEDWLIAYAVNALNPQGILVALVPNGLLSNYGRINVRKGLIERGISLVSNLPPGLLYNRYDISSTGLILVRRDNVTLERPITFLSIQNEEGLQILTEWQKLPSSTRTDSSTNYTSVIIAAKDLGKDYRLDPQYYDPAYLQIKAPEGYYEATIGDIGEIKGGVSIQKEYRRESQETNGLPYFQVRHILANGQISNNLLWASSEAVNENKSKRAMPNDILVTMAGTVGKVIIVPPEFQEGLLFDTSIRRIRIIDDLVSPLSVVEFLSSDLGQLQFRRMTGGTAIPQITTPILASMRVFLPEEKEPQALISEPPPPEISANVTQASVIADAIQSQIVDYLRNVSSDDNNWREIFEHALRTVATNFLTMTLEETVIQAFPAPIAIPYRRLQMARYNHYERLDRMVGLVESCIYFVYHVLVIDYCRRSWQSCIILPNEAKQAFRGKQSIDYRLKFINEVITAARQGTVSLFMPELRDCRIVEVGDLFREEVRNPVAHSAPGSEPYIKSLIDNYIPYIEDLLKSLEFLNQYTLCRIRSHYYQNNEWSYQAEIYRGAEYDFNIQEANSAVILNEDGPRLIEAERDHLVLLSADNDILDLHPFYQLYFGSETCRESHLCFFKYRQGSKLLGESIRSSVEVHLPGVEIFESLTGIAP